MNRSETQVIAHRGASRIARENTIDAFRIAREVGADAVELDVRRTADGALVVHHNPTVDDGRLIADVRAADLPGHIPALSEALDACDGMWVNVEIKNDPAEGDFDPTDSIADRTLELLRARDEDDRWVISCFRLETVDRCRALAPEIRTAWLTFEVPDDVIGTLAARGHFAWHPWVGTLTRAEIDSAHAAGLHVNTWTCDDPMRMGELIAWAIDGICTNVPDVAALMMRLPEE